MKKKIKSTQIREQINNKLMESGYKDKLTEILKERLIQSGWRDKLKNKCKDIISNKGLQKITVEQLINDITPYAISNVPENIKSELLSKLRDFIQKELSS